jgi:hypothetical protein
MRRSLMAFGAGLIGGGLIVAWSLGPASAQVGTGYEVVRKDFTVSGHAVLNADAFCPTGKEILGGGAQIAGEGVLGRWPVRLKESAPDSVGSGAQAAYMWTVTIRNLDDVDHNIGVFAVCADMA